MAYHNISADTQVYPVGPNGWPSGVDNDQGSVRDGGTIADPRFSSTALGEGNNFVTIQSGVNNQVATALANAIWNNQPGQDIQRATSKIAGLDNTVLEGGASDSANNTDSIKQLRVLRSYLYKTAVRAGYWNEFSGDWSTPVTVETIGAWNISSSADNASDLKVSGTDVAANPSSAIPGRLVYLIGNPIPEQDSYPARYNW